MLEQIKNRRTFAIISHPDAGKTTITEKLLLYGGAINMAGSVKAKKSKKHATSDWMELEKQRGISVTSSVMAFPYKKHVINLIDTPGHQDFSRWRSRCGRRGTGGIAKSSRRSHRPVDGGYAVDVPWGYGPIG